MTEGGPALGSPEWYAQTKLVPNVLTIEQLVTMDRPDHSLKKTWIKYQKKRTFDTRKYPPRNFRVPRAQTNYSRVSSYYNVSKRQSRKYGKLHFLRSASHQYAVSALKRDNLYPVICPAAHSAKGHVHCLRLVECSVPQPLTRTPHPTQERNGTMWFGRCGGIGYTIVMRRVSIGPAIAPKRY